MARDRRANKVCINTKIKSDNGDLLDGLAKLSPAKQKELAESLTKPDCDGIVMIHTEDQKAKFFIWSDIITSIVKSNNVNAMQILLEAGITKNPAVFDNFNIFYNTTIKEETSNMLQALLNNLGIGTSLSLQVFDILLCNTISHNNIKGLEILLQYSKSIESITTKDHKGTIFLELATFLDNQQAIDILTPYFNKMCDISHSTEMSNTLPSSLELFPITSGENDNGINQASEALDTTFNSPYQPVESLGLLSIYHNDLSNEQQ